MSSLCLKGINNFAYLSNGLNYAVVPSKLGLRILAMTTFLEYTSVLQHKYCSMHSHDIGTEFAGALAAEGLSCSHILVRTTVPSPINLMFIFSVLVYQDTHIAGASVAALPLSEGKDYAAFAVALCMGGQSM